MDISVPGSPLVKMQQRMPLNQQDQNSQPEPQRQISLKEKVQKQNIAKFQSNKEQEDFVLRLTEFHRHRLVNTPLSYWPTLNGKAVDLYKLYMKVLSLGGWERVCEKYKWEEVWQSLLDSQDMSEFKGCGASGSHALKLIYIRYLSLYEKFEGHMSGLNEHWSTSQSLTSALNGSMGFFMAHNKLSEEGADELGGTINRRRFSYLYDAVPMNYNMNQHHSYSTLDQINETMDPSGDQQVSNRLVYNPYEKLEQSLITGLPNEIDFVFNTAMLLSGDEYHGFKIYSSPRLVDLMLAHIGFFGLSSSNNYRNLYDKVWHSRSRLEEDNPEMYELNNAPDSVLFRRRNFVKFWHNAVMLPEDSNRDLISQLLPEMYNKFLTNLPEQDLFNLRDDKLHENLTNTASPEYRRIEQVMVTLNNLSFEENNADFMANKSSTLFEFLIMCLYCSGTDCYIDLKKHALDILTNLSRRMKIDKMSELHKCLLLVSLEYLINGKHGHRNLPNPHYEGTNSDGAQSQDQFDIIRGLEVLTKLCSQKINPNDIDDYQNEFILSTSQVVYSIEDGTAKYSIQTIEPTEANEVEMDLDVNDVAMNNQSVKLFLNRILRQLEHLLSLQDIFVLLHSLECLYNMSQFNGNICDMIVSFQAETDSAPKLVSMLVNLLTIDMTHFGKVANKPDISLAPGQKAQQNNQQVYGQNVPIKMYKVVPGNGIVATPNNPIAQQQQLQQQSTIQTGQSNGTPKHLGSTTLLQQTLNNQHVTTAASSSVSASKINSQVTNQMNASLNKPVTNQEQQAKSILCNWLRTCFQMDSTSEMSKTKLYPYYQQIAKINNWTVLTIPTFFEILNATFPNLRYNDNQITGIKLVVNIKQQLQMKKDDLIKESTDNWTSQAANVKCSTKAQSPNKNNAPSTLNTTKIKYLLNPSANPAPQQQAVQKPVINGTTENTAVSQQQETKPLTVISDMSTDAQMAEAPLTPILTPPTPKIENIDSKSKSTEISETTISKLDAELNSLKQSVDNKTSEAGSQLQNGHTKTTTASDKPLNGFGAKTTSSCSNSSEGSESDSVESSSPSSSEIEETNDKQSVDVNKENNENTVDKKRKLECEGSTGVEPMAVDQANIDNANKKLCQDADGENKALPTEIKEKALATESTDPPQMTPQGAPAQDIALQQQPQAQQPQQIYTNPALTNGTGGDYLCEWNNCRIAFHTPTQIYNHVYTCHLFNTQFTSGQFCLWSGCDQIKRQKWSLINHLQERHCNENALKLALLNRQRGIVAPQTSHVNSAVINTKDAALIAIQRHQKKNMEEFWSVNDEGPLTKSIRLLSALTLRNLARNSEKGKISVKPYESRLTSIAFDLMESSNTIANCLWHLSN